MNFEAEKSQNLENSEEKAMVRQPGNFSESKEVETLSLDLTEEYVPETPEHIQRERALRDQFRYEVDTIRNYYEAPVGTGWNLQDVIDAHDYPNTRRGFDEILEEEKWPHFYPDHEEGQVNLHTAEPAVWSGAMDVDLDEEQEHYLSKFVRTPPKLRTVPAKFYLESPLTPSPIRATRKRPRSPGSDYDNPIVIEEEGTEEDPIVIE